MNPLVAYSYESNALHDNDNAFYFNNHTTDDVKEVANIFVSFLNDTDLVSTAYIDDYGRFGNFAITIFLNNPNRYSTSSLKAIIRRTVDKVSKIASPHLTVSVGNIFRHEAHRDIWGNINYDTLWWSLDLDIF